MRLATRLVAAMAAAALCLSLAACDGSPDLVGPPEQLKDGEAATLMDAREGLDDAIDTEETLRTSPAQARKLRRRVQSIVSEGTFESERLDEFGLAALGRLGLVVPSLVKRDADGVPESLDRPATQAFLRYAERDAGRAMLLPAQDAVETIVATVEASEAGPDTRIPQRDAAPTLDLRVGGYLREAEHDTQRIWTKLSERLRTLRQGH